MRMPLAVSAKSGAMSMSTAQMWLPGQCRRSIRHASSPLAPFPFFNRSLFDLIKPLEPDEILNLLAHRDVLLTGHPTVVAGTLDFLQRLFGEVEAHQQVGERVDARLVTHVRQFLGGGQGASVAVAPADHVDQ